MTTQSPWVYALIFIVAYLLLARFTLFFGLKLYGSSMEAKIPEEQDAVQRLALMWPITLPVLIANLAIAVCKTVRYWPNAPTKGP